jgi:hypothetical protein
MAERSCSVEEKVRDLIKDEFEYALLLGKRLSIFRRMSLREFDVD